MKSCSALVVPMVAGIALGMLVGCGGSSDSVTHTTSVTPDPTPAFDHTSMQTQDSAWQLPQSRLNLHEELRTTTNIVGASVAGNTAPNGMLRGGVGSSTTVTQVDGYIANEPMPLMPTPSVFQETAGFLGTTAQTRFIAKTVDGVLFSWPYGVSSQIHLPAVFTAGTTWRSEMDMSAESVGRAFVYAPIGQISYRPTIRTVGEALQPGDDADLDARRRAVTVDGTPTDDLTSAAIDYSVADAYRGSWLNVRRIGSFVVIASDVTSPQLSEPGCVHVRLRFSYQLVGERPADLNQTLGLDLFQGGYDLYWKPGTGWLEWSGSETVPSFGIGWVPSGGGGDGVFSLEQYNFEHDRAIFGYNIPYFGDLPYASVFSDGYSAAYMDESPSSWYYAPLPRQALVDALESYRANHGASDLALLNDYGSGRGMRTVIDAAFAAGYALGATRYDEDYDAVASSDDTLKSGRSNRSSVQMAVNRVPAAFRPSSAFRIGAALVRTVVADPWPTGREYPNGHDGLGVIVDAWDGNVVSDTSAIRRQIDAAGVEIRGVYVALPILGYTRTRAISGHVTNSGLVAGGNG